MSGYDDGRAMIARSSSPAAALPDDGSPSSFARFAAIFGAGLATLIGFRVVEKAVDRRINRPPSKLLDQYGRPIERRRR